MDNRVPVYAAVGVTVVLFLAVQLGALALVEPFHEAERHAVEDPDDPTNSFVFFGVILLATALMLAAFKYDAQWFIRGLIILVSVALSWFVFAELAPPIVTIGQVNLGPIIAAVAVGIGLLAYPEWYVIDIAGVLMGAGAAGLFGISFGLLPAIVFLVILAIYDAISVYKTRHMLDLASGVMDLRIPVVFVVPTTLSFSYLDDDTKTALDEASDEATKASKAESAANDSPQPESISDVNDTPTKNAEPTGDDAVPTDRDTIPENDLATADEEDEKYERDALFIGLGDAVIPSILVVSAAFFIDAGALDVPVIALNVPALGAVIGTVLGLLVLLSMILKGKPHAGLPLLNGGAIVGYLVGALSVGVSLSTAVGL